MLRDQNRVAVSYGITAVIKRLKGVHEHLTEMNKLITPAGKGGAQ